MVEEAVDDPPEHSHRRIENDQAAARCQDSIEFGQGRSRILQVMPDIEQDQVGDRPVRTAQGIGVLDPVEPRIRKKIGRDCVWHHCFEVANPRAYFHGFPRQIAP